MCTLCIWHAYVGLVKKSLLGLSPQQFLDVLHEIAHFSKDEPALSFCWSQRAELEQVLKQERRG